MGISDCTVCGKLCPEIEDFAVKYIYLGQRLYQTVCLQCTKCDWCHETGKRLVYTGRSYICSSCNAKRRLLYYKTKRGSNSIRTTSQKMAKIYPEKARARAQVAYWVRQGKLKKPIECPRCGSGERKIQAHHHDYSKPLDVRWLCTYCHADFHKGVLK